MATAKAASAEGASVIVASSKKTNVDRALAELPTGAEGHVLDVTQESAVTDFFSTIGEFDHLAVTAGESLDLGEFATDRNGLFENAGQALPVGRVGEHEDLAETYLYRLRERFSTGAMIVADGGSTLV